MEFSTSKPVDVVVMELLDTGLVAEMQVPALNALRQNGVIGPATRVIPEKIHCYLELVEYDFEFYGFTMRHVVQARNCGVERRIRRLLSDSLCYQTVDCRTWIPPTIDAAMRMRAVRDGVVNAVRLRTQTVLCDGCTLWETSDMNMPVIVPVEPTAVTSESEITISIRYVLGQGYGRLEVRLDR
jgi:predicted RNA methylase